MHISDSLTEITLVTANRDQNQHPLKARSLPEEE